MCPKVSDEANQGGGRVSFSHNSGSGGYADQDEVRQVIVRAPFRAPPSCCGSEQSDPE